MLIQHDFHTHTNLSSCGHRPGATVARYLENARKNGLKKVGFSDHMWDAAVPCPFKWYFDQDFAHVAQLREEIAAADTEGLQVYFGCEVDYDYAHHNVALTEAVAQQFDYILAPHTHTHIVMPKEFYEPHQRHADFMIAAFMDIVTGPMAKYVTAIPHPFAAVNCPYGNVGLMELITDAQYRECFEAAKAADVALEVNLSTFGRFTLAELMNHPALRMYGIAKDCGCKFIFGSDAHTPDWDGIQGRWSLAYVMAELIGITEDDIAEIAR